MLASVNTRLCPSSHTAPHLHVHARHAACAAACLLLAAVAHTASAQCTSGFGPAVTALTATAPKAPIIVDVDLDGLADVLSLSGTSVYCARSLGGGTFASPVVSPAGGTQPPVTMLAGDFNRDGLVDLVTVNQSGAAINILRGNGTGSFTAMASYVTGCGNPNTVAAGDFNGDGITDLAVGCNLGSISIFLGVGDGSFTPGATFASGGVASTALACADFDGDGRLDLVAGFSVSPQIVLMKGAGNGTFPTIFPTTISGVSPNALAIGDLNSDGRPDLVLSASGIIMGLLTNPAGNFGSLYTIATGSGLNSGAALVDLDGNGRLDIVCTGGSANTVSYLMGTAGILFTAPVNISQTGNPVATAIGDLNLDGRPDFVVTCTTGNQVRAFTGLFDGTISITAQPATTSVLEGAPASFTVAATGLGRTYQWRRNGVNLTNTPPYSGVNSATLTVNPAALTSNLDIFDVVLSNACNTVTSRPAALGVTGCAGDFNQDGSVDFFDYLDFVGAFTAGC